MEKPLVFISSTGDLRTSRALVARVLTSLGYEPVWQDAEATRGGELCQVLRDRIAPCHLVLQLVGSRYGAEPPAPTPEFGRCSYTQYEALHAEAAGVRVVYIWLPDELTDDADPEGAELAALQEAYRRRLVERNVLRHEVDTAESLENVVLRLRDDLAALRATGERRHRRLVGLVGLTLVAVLATLAAIALRDDVVVDAGASDERELAQDLAAIGLEASDVRAEDFELAVRPYAHRPNTGVVDVAIDARLGWARDFVEVRVGERPWKSVVVDTAGRYYALLDELDMADPGLLQVRVDRQKGPGTGAVIGPFTYDVRPGEVVRSGQAERVRSDTSWLSLRRNRVDVDADFMRENADAIVAVVWGDSPDALTGRLAMPPDLGPDAAEELRSQRAAGRSVFYSQLELEMSKGPRDRAALHARLELAGGELGALASLRFETEADKELAAAHDLLEGPWVRDDTVESGVLALEPLREVIDSVSFVRFGTAPDDLLELELLKGREAGDRKDWRYLDRGLRYNSQIPVPPGAATGYLQLGFVDGHVTAVREIALGEQPLAGGELPRVEPFEPDAPRLWAVFQPGPCRIDLLTTSPAGTARTIYAFGDGSFAETQYYGGWWQGRGFGLRSWEEADTLQLVHQLPDGAEVGPTAYALDAVPGWVRAGYAAALRAQRREAATAVRLDFEYDPAVPNPTSREERDARKRAENRLRNTLHQVATSEITAPCIVVQSAGLKEPHAWVAAASVRLGADPGALDAEVALDFDPWAALDRSPNRPYWHARLPAGVDEVWMQIVLHGGEELSPVRVPVTEVTLD